MSLPLAKSEAQITGLPHADFTAGTVKRTAAQLAKSFQRGNSRNCTAKTGNR